MDSFKFNTLNYQDTDSLVSAQNKIIDSLTKDKKTLLQDEGNYAAFREKEKARQQKQLMNIIAGVPKLKQNIEAAKVAKEAGAELDDLQAESVAQQKEQAKISTGEPVTGMQGSNVNDLTKQEEKKRLLDQKITSGIQDPKAEVVTKSTLQRASTQYGESNQIRRNTRKTAIDLGTSDANTYYGEGLAYSSIAEKGQFEAVKKAEREFLIARVGTAEFQALDRRNKLLYLKTFKGLSSNYTNQAARAWIAKSNTAYIADRRNTFLEDVKLNPGKAVEDYIFKHEYFGNTKNTRLAYNQLRNDLEALEETGDVTADTYSQILSGEITDRSTGTRKKIADLNNGFSNWIQGRQITLSTKKNQDEIKRDRNNALADIEQGEIEFEQYQLTNPTDEQEFQWRQDWLSKAYKRHKTIPYGDPIWAKWQDGLTRLDGPDHSITVQRLVDDHRNNAPLDDEMYKSLPLHWKKQFQKAIGGTDDEEGSSGESIGTGKLAFKSYFNALKEGGGWHTHIMDKLQLTDIQAAKGNPKFGWILFQGQEDYVTKFQELKKIGSVRDAQAGALAFIKGKYKEYYDTPIEEGFDTKIISSITEGRGDIIPRLRGKSQEVKLEVLNQPTFWEGEEVAYGELLKWSKGYGEFPQYYRQIDDNMFKDMTPRDLALHRMNIHKDREEGNKEADEPIKVLEKEVKLKDELYNNLPFDTARLFTFRPSASRTYRAEIQEKDNTDLYEHLKVNDDPNAYTLTNPYILERPSDNLSEMSLIEVLKEAGSKRIKTLGLYSLTPKNIMNVLSEEEKINGFLNTTFDEELQTELKRRLARISANKANQYGALVEDPNPLPNLIPQDIEELSKAFGPQDWSSIPPTQIKWFIEEIQN